jgi:hypothetical protein
LTVGSTPSQTPTARGPSDLAANLAWLVAKDRRDLRDFRAVCPPESASPSYPINCGMTAIDTSKFGHPGKPAGERRPVSGTATIYGVYAPTRTYAYGLEYAPTRS